MIALLTVVPCLFLAADVPAPSADQLIQRALEKRKAQEDKGWKYTWREDVEQINIDRKGKPLVPVHKTFDVIMLEGENYRKLVLIDGKPLDAKTQKKVDAEVERTRQERRRIRLTSITRTVSLGGLDDLARMFDNKVAGEETVDGRKAWRIDSTPKPGYKPSNGKEADKLASHFTTWIDQEEGVELRNQQVFDKALKSFQPGTLIETRYGKVGDAWLVQAVDLQIKFKFMGMFKGEPQNHVRYVDYKRFEVETRITPDTP